ncbi:MAG: hypothetical protein ACXABY_29480, partial [Candidatus Thorarchaeota archaeon]
EATSAWTAETAVTFRLKTVEGIKSLFRTKHKEDGDHINDGIKDQHIDWGTGAGQVSAGDVPIADAGGRITATEIENALQELAGAGRTTETIKDNADDFAVGHKGTDGDHKDDVIKDKHIDFGTGAGQVSAVDVPIEDADGYYAATEIEAALKEILEGFLGQTLTAGEALSVGDPVGLYADRVGPCTIDVLDDEQQEASVGTAYHSDRFPDKPGRFAVVYRNSTNNGYIRIGEVAADGTISWLTSSISLGTDVLSSGTDHTLCVSCFGEDLVACVKVESAANQYGYMRVGQYTGGSITWKTSWTSYYSTAALVENHCIWLESQYICAMFRQSAGGILNRVMIYNGSTLVAHTTATTIDASSTRIYGYERFPHKTNEWTVVYFSASTIKMMAFALDGTTIRNSVAWSIVTASNSGVRARLLTTDTIAILYNDNSSPKNQFVAIWKFWWYIGATQPGAENAFSILSNDQRIHSDDSSYQTTNWEIEDMGGGYVIIQFNAEPTGTDEFNWILAKFDGNGLLQMAGPLKITTTTTIDRLIHKYVGKNMFVVGYQGQSGYVRYLLVKVPLFMGISKSAVSAGNPAVVACSGVVKGLSGFNPSQVYGVDYTDGSFREKAVPAVINAVISSAVKIL